MNVNTERQGASCALPMKSPNAPSPKFNMFELVVLTFRTDEGDQHSDVVQIMGLEFCPPDSPIPGWHYHIQYIKAPSWGAVKAGYREPCEEVLLHKMEQKLTL